MSNDHHEKTLTQIVSAKIHQKQGLTFIYLGGWREEDVARRGGIESLRFSTHLVGDFSGLGSQELVGTETQDALVHQSKYFSGHKQNSHVNSTDRQRDRQAEGDANSDSTMEPHKGDQPCIQCQ